MGRISISWPSGLNAATLLFGSYYGSTSDEHVDGGAPDRFDNNGIIYQGICTNAPTFPGSTGTVFPTNGRSWNVVTVKVAFELGVVNAIASANNAQGCGRSPFSSRTLRRMRPLIYGILVMVRQPPPCRTLHILLPFPGTYTVMLAATSTFACNTNDTAYITVIVDTGGVVAGFTHQIVDSCGPYTATFTNTSIPFSNNATYSWDFGDNTTFHRTQPAHSYLGQARIPSLLSFIMIQLLLATNGTRSHTDCLYDIRRSGQCHRLSVRSGLCAVQCTVPERRYKVNIYNWTLVMVLLLIHKAHRHIPIPQAGTFTVTFIGSNNSPSACKNADTAYLVITVDTGNVLADFTAVVTDSCDDFTVEIFNTSPYFTSSTVFTWSFGDGTTFVGQCSLSHDYPGVGTYTITLVVTDSTTCNGIDSISKTITITNFFVDAVLPDLPNVCAPGEITFSHSSTNAQSVYWNIGDGITSTSNNFTHTYTTPGEYPILFIATDLAACKRSDTLIDTVVIGAQAIADFNGHSGGAGLEYAGTF